LFDDAVGSGEPEPRSFADWLCGEERLERAGARCGIHAGTSIGNTQRDVWPRLDIDTGMPA
jgi:hypothetical protein